MRPGADRLAVQVRARSRAPDRGGPGRGRGRAAASRPRRSRICSMPAVGSSARISTASPAPTCGAADDVEHPVHAVAEVDVDASRAGEHARVALRRPRERVRGGIVAPVGLALHDAAADAVDEQLAADQVVRDREARARAPAPRCRSRRRRPARASARGARPRCPRAPDHAPEAERRIGEARRAQRARRRRCGVLPLSVLMTTIWSASPRSEPTRRRNATPCPNVETVGL